eukprot:197642-Amphidinium_carterae.1
MNPGFLREAEFQNRRRALPALPWEQGWVGRALGYQRAPWYELPHSAPVSQPCPPVGDGNAAAAAGADCTPAAPPPKRFKASQGIGKASDRALVIGRWKTFLSHDLESSR